MTQTTTTTTTTTTAGHSFSGGKKFAALMSVCVVSSSVFSGGIRTELSFCFLHGSLYCQPKLHALSFGEIPQNEHTTCASSLNPQKMDNYLMTTVVAVPSLHKIDNLLCSFEISRFWFIDGDFLHIKLIQWKSLNPQIHNNVADRLENPAFVVVDIGPI